MPNQQTQPYERTLTDDINTTPEISVDRFRFGRIINRSGGPVTLTVHESEKHGSPYVLCGDVGTNGTLAALADGESAEFPTALQGSRFLKLVTSAGNALIQFVFKG